MNVYDIISNLENKDLALLILRITVGLLIFLHGYPKLFGISGLADYFKSIDIPSPKISAILSIISEALGGLLIILGFLTPFAAVFLIVNMIVATIVAKMKQGRSLITGNNLISGFEVDLLYLVGFIVLLLTGPGLYSLDTLLF